MTAAPIGIMGAMREEISTLRAHVCVDSTRTLGRREFVSGVLFDRRVVVVESRWGKVAAAVTATRLIADFGVSEVLFTGVAGALDPGLRIGDIVVAERLYQHDLDASPIYPPLQVPLLGVEAIASDAGMSARLREAAERFVSGGLAAAIDAGTLAGFGIVRPRVVSADIATGDRFVSRRGEGAALGERIPSAACVEMEGAAVAQVCFEHGVKFAVVRTISDTADHSAAVDFPRFLGEVAGRYAEGIVGEYLGRTAREPSKSGW